MKPTTLKVRVQVQQELTANRHQDSGAGVIANVEVEIQQNVSEQCSSKLGLHSIRWDNLLKVGKLIAKLLGLYDDGQ